MNGGEVQRGLIRLPLGSERVQDADEEVFLLYSKSTSSSDIHRGLGYLDNHLDTLTLSFELKSPPLQNSAVVKSKRKSNSRSVQEKTVEIELAQDKTALRTRTGDTGSVVWKASIDFAQLVLQQHHAKSPVSILDPEKLRGAHVLELGSGTGLLSIALSPLVQQYTATDLGELLPLIRKNLSLNFPGWPHTQTKQGTAMPGHNVVVEELNWQTLLSTASSRRARLFPRPSPPADLVLIVDCIYHPALLASLVAAMDFVSTTDSTAVLVVMELRAEDVTREFLERWLTLSSGEWEIWRVGNDEPEGMLAKETPYVMWVGWKSVGD
ncbi:putative methyltransferase-domain-containing protein [Mycena belliarum]|uniref:Methyltransferase-domain-containing protein n=1 Tax=Mycena belliarum TaxID=1033014 RepID=A0AAD6U5U4_9AGAR|nr:putative methyltransferase-domain-containing protein [Mycena belliae]